MSITYWRNRKWFKILMQKHIKWVKNSLHCEMSVLRQEILLCRKCIVNQMGTIFLLNYSDLLGRDVLTILLLWQKAESGHFCRDRWHKSKTPGLCYLSLHIQKKQAELYILYLLDCKTVFPGKYYLKFPRIVWMWTRRIQWFFVFQPAVCVLLPSVSKWGLFVSLELVL